MFDFQEFIEKLQSDDEKREIVEKYKNIVKQDLSECNRFEKTKTYTDYLRNFDENKIDQIEKHLLKPEYIEDDFDYALLLRLTAASFSSSWSFEMKYNEDENPKISLLIDVNAGEKYVTKRLDDLWGFQIARMYEIYIVEQLNLTILYYEDESEKKIVTAQREKNINYFNREHRRISHLYKVITGEAL